MSGKKRRFHMNLLTMMTLFLFVFFLTVLFQLLLSNYRSRYIIAPIQENTGNIQAISQFLNSSDNICAELEAFRWEYGDSDNLVSSVMRQKAAARLQLEVIEKELDQVGKEQYLLASASETAFKAFSSALDQMVSSLLSGNTEEAAALYYNKINIYGKYLIEYTSQLQRQAILDNQESYTRIIRSNDLLTELQYINLILCVVFGFLVLIGVIRVLGIIKLMSQSSVKISQGELTTPDIQYNHQDEIGNLVATFNEMKHSMSRQVELLEEKRAMESVLYKKENEALGLQNLIEREKLQQLRSQINPHFLFNTLNVIKLTAADEGAVNTESLIGSLSKLYRFALASNDSETYLSHEIQIVNEFYALYKARFADKMKIVWVISPDISLTETLVPSFILQPLVENAFKYGLSPMEGKGKVLLFIKEENGFLKCIVEDDGVGMSQETLDAIRLRLENPPHTGEHIGLYNIAARLKLLGNGSGMQIESTLGSGTKVTLRLPYKVESEGDCDVEDSDCR